MKKQVVYMSLILFSLFHTGMAAEKPWEKLGRIAEFQVIDTRGEERNVQVFIPHNINY